MHFAYCTLRAGWVSSAVASFLMGPGVYYWGKALADKAK